MCVRSGMSLRYDLSHARLDNCRPPGGHCGAVRRLRRLRPAGYKIHCCAGFELIGSGREAHNVRMHTTGVKLLHHPVLGDLDLPFETFPLGDGPSQFLLTYTAEPTSPSHEALNLLASWAANNDHIERSAAANDSEAADSAETPD